MNSTALLAAVKSRLNIKTADTSHDARINEFGVTAVGRLYPTAAFELAPQETTSFAVTDGETILDLTAFNNMKAARQVEAYNGYGWQRITDTYHHGTTLRLREIEPNYIKLRLYGVRQFATIDEVYDWLTLAVILFCQAEFYAFMADNAADYNIYIQTTGARAVDNLTDLSSNFEGKALRYLDDQAQAYGL